MSTDWEKKFREAEAKNASLVEENSALRKELQRISSAREGREALKEKITSVVQNEFDSFSRVLAKGKYSFRYQTAANRLRTEFSTLLQELQDEQKLILIPGPNGTTYVYPYEVGCIFEGKWPEWGYGLRLNFNYHTRSNKDTHLDFESFKEKYGKKTKTDEGQWEAGETLERGLASAIAEVTEQRKLRLTTEEGIRTADEERISSDS